MGLQDQDEEQHRIRLIRRELLVQPPLNLMMCSFLVYPAYIAGAEVTRFVPESIITEVEVNFNGLRPEEEEDETKERKAQWKEEDQHNGNTDPAEDHGLLQESNPQESILSNPQESILSSPQGSILSNPQGSKKVSNGQESPPPQPVCNGLVSPETEEPKTPESEGSGALPRKVTEIRREASEMVSTSFRVREEEELSPEEEEQEKKNQEEVTEEAQDRSWEDEEQNRSHGEEEEEATEMLDNIQYGGEQESLKDGE